MRAGRRNAATTATRAIVCHVASDILACPTHEIAATVSASSVGVIQARSPGTDRLLPAGLTVDAPLARSRMSATAPTTAGR